MNNNVTEVSRLQPQILNQNFKEQLNIKRISDVDKICRCCNIIKKITNFPKDKRKKDGYSIYCREGWHIDHIKPCVSFDLADHEQQKECFHYSNLQPLWAIDNMSKGVRIDV